MKATIHAKARSGTGMSRGTNTKPMPIKLAPLEDEISIRPITEAKYVPKNRASLVGRPKSPPTLAVVLAESSHVARSDSNSLPLSLAGASHKRHLFSEARFDISHTRHYQS